MYRSTPVLRSSLNGERVGKASPGISFARHDGWNMRSFLDAKLMAKSLRAALERQGTALTHSQSLEIVAGQFGFASWNVLAARIGDAGSSPGTTTEGPAIGFHETAPILRTFSEEKAKEFYLGFLGFTLDWEHRFHPGMPLYCQVSRSGLILHLSEHHGDATPGSTTFVAMRGLRAFNAEVLARRYANNRPGIEEADWGLVMEVIDPFGNRIRFCERPENAG
jgi:catechol 2,3-dioxygenase-like lactoylglutathione lyase family enzyme